MKSKEYYINLYIKYIATGLMNFADNEEIINILNSIKFINSVNNFEEILYRYPEIEELLIKNGLYINMYFNFAILSKHYAKKDNVDPMEWQLGYYLSQGEDAYDNFLSDLEYIQEYKEGKKYLWYDIRKAEKEFINMMKNI